jgi:hypothetical protein
MKRSIVARNTLTGEILVFESAVEASKKYGFDESHIIKCCRGRRNKHKGYTWSYYLPIKSLEDVVKEKAWTLAEDNQLKVFFGSGNLEKLVETLPGRNFKDIMCRAQILSLRRHTPQAKNITPYDLIYELAEDIFFEDFN